MTGLTGEAWATAVGLSPGDLQRLPLMVQALADALDATAGCGCACAWRSLDDNYRKSEFLLAERDEDGLLSWQFVVDEFNALFHTISTISALAGQGLEALSTEKGQDDGSR